MSPVSLVYCDKICVYYEHPLAGQDIQYRAPDSRSSYTKLTLIPTSQPRKNSKSFQKKLAPLAARAFFVSPFLPYLPQKQSF